MKYSDVLEMHWYMIIVHVSQGFKKKSNWLTALVPAYVYKYGTWPTCGMQARPVGVTSGIHDPIYMLPALLGS